MKTTKLYCRIASIDDESEISDEGCSIKATLEIGIGSSDLHPSETLTTKLDRIKTFPITFIPSTYLELQKLKSLYSTNRALLARLRASVKSLDLTDSGNRAIARDRLIAKINVEGIQAMGIEQRVNTKTGELKNFLNYGLNYYLTQQPTSSYSVWLKNTCWIPTGRQYHSDYLDLDEVHAVQDFNDGGDSIVISPVQVIEILDESIDELQNANDEPTDAELEAIELANMQVGITH